MNILFGNVKSDSYLTFSSFATFLSYQPLTLSYVSPAGTWQRDARVASLNKSEIGGGVSATDKLNESFTLDFLNPWYSNKSVQYIKYNPDPNLGTYGKIYRPKYDPTVNRNLLLGTKDYSGAGNWSIINGELVEKVYQGLDAIQTANAWGGPKYNNSALESQGVIQSVDDTFVMSAWVRNTDTTPKDIYFYGDFISSQNYKVVTLAANSDWVRINSQPFQFSQTSGLTGSIRFEPTTDSTDGYVQQVGLKLEKGSIATDWTPALEDNLTIPFGYAYGVSQINGPYTDFALADVAQLEK